MAQKIVAGNWKMNLSLNEGVKLVNGIESKIDSTDVRIIVFTPSLFAHPISQLNKKDTEVGVQNFNENESGAFTGEVSVNQVKSIGVNIGLIGHSERRLYYNENNSILKSKVDAAIGNDFEFIFCCGEPLEIREANNEFEYVKKQLEESLFHLSELQIKGGTIAYEPVWAIGTGKTASTEQAEEMHKAIRSWIAERYSEEIAETISILYGGSCNPKNAEELFACPNVDGGLIGGASLNAEDFCAIIKSF
ncbi:MAG: triose-phosphate isomerase [Crocinitomicaceae bacterium]|jgi:triosephosphate isomerase (TIM)|nr:triose-phosphate isomerase [Crocinitomicaceae bacterium]